MLLLALSALSALAAPMGYDEALSRAGELNPNLAMARASVELAEGGLLASRGVWDPTLGLGLDQGSTSEKGRFQGVAYTADSGTWNWSASLRQTLPTGTSWSASWTNLRLNVSSEFAGIEQPPSLDFESRTSFLVTQQLLRGYKLSYNLAGVRSAEANLRAAEAQLLQARQTALSDVASAYWDLAYADAALRVAEESVAVAEEERRVVQAMVEAGTMAPIEATRVEAALAQARLARIEAENALDASSDVLAVLLRLPLGERIEPTTDPGEVPMGISLDAADLIERALAANPGLQAARVDLENAELSLVNARHGLLPTLSLTAGAGLQGRPVAEDGQPAPDYGDAVAEMLSGAYNNRFIGLDLSVPLGLRAERGQVQSQAASLDMVRITLANQEALVAQQVAAAARTVETARQRVQLADLNLQLARETLAAEEARREAGRAIERDVLDAQRALDSAKVEVIRARTDYRKALVALEALQGQL